jgi:hypothetical protein
MLWMACASRALAEPYVDPHGFSIDVPAGYIAAPVHTEKMHGINVESLHHDMATVMYMDVPTGVEPRVLSDVIFSALSSDTQGHVRSQFVESTTPYVEVRQYDLTARGVARTANVMVYVAGTNATVYMAAAPRERFKKVRPALIAILQSFRYGGTPVAAPTSFLDPREQAFSVSFPAGWSVEGGTFRKSSFEAGQQLKAMSASHDAFVLGYDPYPQMFVAPNALLARAGYREGAVFSPGYGVQEVVMRPLSPAGMLRWLGSHDRNFAGIVVGNERLVPTMSGNARYGNITVSQQSAWIDVSFSGSHQHGEALVQVTQTLGSQDIWYATVSLWSAAPGHEAVALEGFDMAQRTYCKDAQWQAREDRMAIERGNAAAAVAAPVLTPAQPYHNGIQAANEKINQMRMGSFHYQQAVGDHLAQLQHDTTMGTQRMRNPSTGQVLEVPSGSSYYYQLPAGTGPVLGTNGGRPPGPNMILLQKLP